MMEKTFLEQVLDDILSKENPLEKTAVILPSRRSITFFYRALSDRLKDPILPPKCLTLDDIVRMVLPKAPIDPLTARLELYQAYSEVYPDPEPFEYFDSWSSAILSDFNTIDTHLIESGELYRDLRNLKDLDEEWSFMQDEWGGHQGEFNSFWTGLASLYDRYHERLEDIGRVALGHALKQLVQNKAEHVLPGIDEVWVVGFNALSPAETSLLDLIHESGRLQVRWDAAEFYLKDKENTAGLFIRRWLNKPWSQKVLGPIPQNRVHVTFSEHAHGLAQCKFSGNRLLDFVREEEQVAIVLADESLLPAMLQSMPHSISAVNVTMGLSIQGQKAFQLTELFMSMMLDAKRNYASTKRWTIHAHSIIRWMESALEAGVLDERTIEGIREHLIKERWIRLDESQVADLFPESLSVLFDPLNEDVVILERLNGLLALAMPLHPLDQGVKDSMLDVLSTLEDKIKEYPFMHQLDLIWKFLRSAWLQEKTSFIGEPLEGVQVMGLLETRALDFNKVILVGANEGILPKSRRFDTFIPALIRSHYGLPTQKEEDAVFAYYFYRLLQYPKQVHVTYGSEKNETGGGEMSRYLRQLIYGAPQEYGWNMELKAISEMNSAKTAGEPELVVRRSPEIIRSIENFFDQGVSVSRLNEYLRCPLDFYFKKLLGLREKESLEEEVASNELGDLVHEILEDLFKLRIGKGHLVKADIENMLKTYGSGLTEKIRTKGLHRIMESGESALTKAIAFKMLGNFFQREMKRVDKDHIEVIEVEEEKEYTMELTSGDKTIPVRFTAKIDRHDRVGEEHWILDYKTGKVDGNQLKITSFEPEELFDPKRSKGLQLLYYTWLYWRATGISVKAGIISMLGMETEPATLSLNGKNDLKEEDLLTFEQRLKDKLIELYEQKEFRHDEEHGLYCDYCPIPAENSY